MKYPTRKSCPFKLHVLAAVIAATCATHAGAETTVDLDSHAKAMLAETYQKAVLKACCGGQIPAGTTNIAIKYDPNSGFNGKWRPHLSVKTSAGDNQAPQQTVYAINDVACNAGNNYMSHEFNFASEFKNTEEIHADSKFETRISASIEAGEEPLGVGAKVTAGLEFTLGVDFGISNAHESTVTQGASTTVDVAPHTSTIGSLIVQGVSLSNVPYTYSMTAFGPIELNNVTWTFSSGKGKSPTIIKQGSLPKLSYNIEDLMPDEKDRTLTTTGKYSAVQGISVGTVTSDDPDHKNPQKPSDCPSASDVKDFKPDLGKIKLIK